jgi:hypothetical protein
VQRYSSLLTKEDSMKKLGYVIAALGVFAIAAPSIASAEEFAIGRDRDHKRAEFREHREFRDRDRLRSGARAEYRERREWRERGWRHRHADKVMIIKKRHHEER